MNFTKDRQPLVDAAFLAHGLLRAPRALREGLDAATRANLVRALESTRVIVPAFSNWLLFSATVEAGLAALGAPWDRVRVDYALRQHAQWYKGDGDLRRRARLPLGLLQQLRDPPDAARRAGRAGRRFGRLEGACASPRSGAPSATRPSRSGSSRPRGRSPPIGRSIAYRFGAFQLLAQIALRRELPAEVSPAQVRGALTAVIRRSIEAPGTFDEHGLAAHRLRGPPARRGRALHLDGQPLPLRGGTASARPARVRSLLGRSGDTLDGAEGLVRPALPDRPRAAGLIRARPTRSAAPRSGGAAVGFRGGAHASRGGA